MFTHLIHLKTEKYTTNSKDYELNVHKVAETGEHRIYVSHSGDSVGDIFTASSETISDFQQAEKNDLVETLISIAKRDIDRDEFDLY